MKKKLLAFTLTTALFTSPFTSMANNIIPEPEKTIIVSEKLPESFYFNDKNPVPQEEKNYCLDQLNYLANLLRTKTYDQLTQEEKARFEEIKLIFFQTGICTSRLLPGLIQYEKLKNEYPSDRLVIIIDDKPSRKMKNYTLDGLKLIEDIYPRCQNIKELPQKIKCILEGDREISNPQRLEFVPIVVFTILKYKYPESVMLIKFENRPIFPGLGDYKTSLDFRNRFLKDFLQGKIKGSVCLSEARGISCPAFHLEMGYEEDFIERDMNKIIEKYHKEAMEKRAERIARGSYITQNSIYKFYYQLGKEDWIADTFFFVKKGILTEEEKKTKEIYERSRKLLNWFENNFVNRKLLK